MPEHTILIIEDDATLLRAKIESDPRRPKYIQTIRDIGYRFDLTVEDDAEVDAVDEHVLAIVLGKNAHE